MLSDGETDVRLSLRAATGRTWARSSPSGTRTWICSRRAVGPGPARQGLAHLCPRPSERAARLPRRDGCEVDHSVVTRGSRGLEGDGATTPCWLAALHRRRGRARWSTPSCMPGAVVERGAVGRLRYPRRGLSASGENCPRRRVRPRRRRRRNGASRSSAPRRRSRQAARSRRTGCSTANGKETCTDERTCTASSFSYEQRNRDLRELAETPHAAPPSRSAGRYRVGRFHALSNLHARRRHRHRRGAARQLPEPAGPHRAPARTWDLARKRGGLQYPAPLRRYQQPTAGGESSAARWRPCAGVRSYLTGDTAGLRRALRTATLSSTCRSPTCYDQRI